MLYSAILFYFSSVLFCPVLSCHIRSAYFTPGPGEEAYILPTWLIWTTYELLLKSRHTMLLLLLYIHLYIQRPHGRHTHTYPRVAWGWGPPAAFIISLHRILFFGILVGWMLYCIIIISGLSDLEIIWSVFRFPRKETDTDTETSIETEWEWEWKWESDHFLAVQALLFWVLTTLSPQSTLKVSTPAVQNILVGSHQPQHRHIHSSHSHSHSHSHPYHQLSIIHHQIIPYMI